MAEESRQQIDTDKEALASGVTEVELWLRKIKAQKDEEKSWRSAAEEAIKIYESPEETETTFNVLFSNGQTLLPALYNSQPVPDIRRRYGDADPIGKQVVDVSERMINYTFDHFDFDTEMEAAVQDSYVTGRGIIRIRYIPHENGHKKATTERVIWDKFIRGPARSWAKMPWIAFEHDLTRDELVQLNGEIGKTINLGDGDTDSEGQKKDTNEAGIKRTARTYEVWDRASGQVIFICEKHKAAPLLKTPDPLKIPGFFPCMKPLQPTKRVKSMTPIVPYNAFKKQAEELNRITARINKLIGQLRVRGIVDPTYDGDFQQLKDCEDGQFISAGDSTKEFQAGAAGLDKSVWVWPMEPTVLALRELYVQRDQVRAIIDQISGVSDILRGQVDPREKLGQSQIKQQSGSIRITKWQSEIAALCRDVIRGFVALFAKHYSDENISAMTMLPQSEEQQQQWPQVLQVFRDDLLRGYRIDIETDSTIRADMTRNQEQMNQFLAGTGQFAQAMAGAVEQFGPPVMPVMAEVYTAFARKFKLGKQAEDALDKLSQMAQEMAQQPQQEQPDPEAEKIKMQMQALQQKAQLEAQTAQQKAAIEIQKLQAEADHAQRMAQLKERELILKLDAQERQLQMKERANVIDAQAQQHTAAIQAEAADRDFDRDQRRADAEAANAERAGQIKLDGMKRQQQMKQKPEARTNG